MKIFVPLLGVHGPRRMTLQDLGQAVDFFAWVDGLRPAPSNEGATTVARPCDRRAVRAGVAPPLSRHGQYRPSAPADRHQLVAEDLAVLDGLDAVLAHREPQLLDPRAGDHQFGAVELDAHAGIIGLDHQGSLGRLEPQHGGHVAGGLAGGLASPGEHSTAPPA